jgi:predicted XRE-type DNA-binding protein
MTKISIDVDFDKDPKTIFKEIQEKAKTEVEKREKKEKAATYLENLHTEVNHLAGTSYSNVNELIRALAAFATPSLRDRIQGVSASGRRKTISMTQSLYEQIKVSLERDGLSKAEIARATGVSSTQVTKIQRGGYEAKFGRGGNTTKTVSSQNTIFSREDPVPVSDNSLSLPSGNVPTDPLTSLDHAPAPTIEDIPAEFLPSEGDATDELLLETIPLPYADADAGTDELTPPAPEETNVVDDSASLHEESDPLDESSN